MVDKTIEVILKNHGAYSSELELLLLRNLDQVVRAHIEKLEAELQAEKEENQKLMEAIEEQDKDNQRLWSLLHELHNAGDDIYNNDEYAEWAYQKIAEEVENNNG